MMEVKQVKEVKEVAVGLPPLQGEGWGGDGVAFTSGKSRNLRTPSPS